MAGQTKNFALRGDPEAVDALNELKGKVKEHLGLESDADLMPLVEAALRERLEGAVAPALNDYVGAVRRAMSVIDMNVGAIVATYAAQDDAAEQRWAGRLNATASALEAAQAEAARARLEAEERVARAEADRDERVGRAEERAREAEARAADAEGEAAELRSQLAEAREELARGADVLGRLDAIMGALGAQAAGER